MSRTNPYKKKRRQANKTLLIFGEGLGEEMFLKHLKNIYSYNKNVAIKIRKGKGGTADGIVMCAYKTPGAFDRKIVILEHLLLSILGERIESNNSQWCKDKFESKFIDKKKRGDPKEYIKFFSKKILDNKRIKISQLNRLIFIMQGL
ncbi:MAG: hypothetical protein Q8N88_07120 [Nanoarchaeota archaeon]|nr:hypothetical protein [Nanoarchaeota archaeon]